MYIDPHIIDEIMHSVSLEEVVRATGFHMRGRGKYRGIEVCPRCGRDWTHIKLNTHRNLFVCMSPSCGWAGNQFHWVMEVEKLSFPEAVKRVAEIGQYPLPSPSDPKRKRYYQCIQAAAAFYAQFSHTYFEKRGIGKELVRKMQLGYAQGGQRLKKHLNRLGYDDEFLLSIRLIREVSPGVFMDTFFKRVIIPIAFHNTIVDLYGRSVIDSDEYKHMYLNGKRIFMGLDDFITKKPAILLEGPFDYLALKQHGIQNVAFIGGAGKFSPFHLQQIKKKQIDTVYIGYDTGDESGAGQEAAIKTGKMLTDAGLNVFVLEMPKGLDVADYLLTHSIEDYRALVERALPFEKYHAFYTLSQLNPQYILEYITNFTAPSPSLVKNGLGVVRLCDIIKHKRT